jgi:hypothetical protein
MKPTAVVLTVGTDLGTSMYEQLKLLWQPALIGELVAAAVILDPEQPNKGLMDSKKNSVKQSSFNLLKRFGEGRWAGLLPKLPHKKLIRRIFSKVRC